jgi:hypothetical protein
VHPKNIIAQHGHRTKVRLNVGNTIPPSEALCGVIPLALFIKAVQALNFVTGVAKNPQK